MALPKSGIRVPRKTIAGMEGMWTKMWDPPRASPTTPELITPTNPVPGFMASVLGGSPRIANTVTRDLLSGLSLPTWDGQKVLDFMVFSDDDFTPGGSWPGPTIRVPRGVVFHCDTQGKGPPPHTIHWHGIEPTPMNDGVGHCSMELGQYTYQLQPNFIGTYFYHCHRNTVQHFEFGLYGMFLVEPPDAYNASIPIDAGGQNKNVGGYPRRTAANLADFGNRFPGFVSGHATFGVGNAADTGVGDPHAFTVRYDVEALWVLDDRDSNWSDLAMNAKAFYPGGANTQDGPLSDEVQAQVLLPGVPVTRPGVDDQFPHGFFHDFNADYWFVTGVPVPAPKGGTATIDPAGPAPTGGGLPVGARGVGVIPANLNSGVSGMQVDVAAQVNETVLVRVLNAAYNSIEVTFPLDVVIIAFDGRALGVPPFARYNHAFELKKDTPYRLSTARRFDALIRSNGPFSGFATVKFFDTRGLEVLPNGPLCTARIPINITN